jgi:hypothetical protein
MPRIQDFAQFSCQLTGGLGNPHDCIKRIWVVSPRKVSWFAPLNRYYIILDEVFFDNLLVIIYLLVVFIHFGQWNIVEHKRENIFRKKESSWRGLDSLN